MIFMEKCIKTHKSIEKAPKKAQNILKFEEGLNIAQE